MSQIRPINERLQEARRNERWTQVYRETPEVFRAFERAEDPQGLAAKRLVELAGLQGKRVLEIGAGTGWMTRFTSGAASGHVAVEPEAAMIASAEGFGRARVVQARGEHLPFVSGSFDAAIMSWVLLDLRPKLRTRVLEECDRLIASDDVGHQLGTRHGPGTWVIENAANGEFQERRGIQDPDGLGEVAPLVTDCGFEVIEVVETEMRFRDSAEAEATLGTILGDKVKEQLRANPRSSFSFDLAILFRPKSPNRR